MKLTLNKVVQPKGTGRNLNDFCDGTNTTKNFQNKTQASKMPSADVRFTSE